MVMRVLFIFPYLTFEPRVANYVANMAKMGHDMFVVAYSKDRRGWSQIDGITWFFVDAISFSFGGMVWKFPYFLHLEDLIKQIKPDIIHINNLPFLTTLQTTRIAKKLGIANIIHVHGVIGKWNKLLDILQYSYLRIFGRQFFKNANLIICLTKSDASEVQQFGCPSKKIRLIPNGVDVDEFKPAKETKNLLFWGGRFLQQKGLEYLIEALSLVAQKAPSTRLILSGDGALFFKIYSMVKKLGLEKNVKFLGRVQRTSLPKLVGSCSIYVLPSLKEGMPYALLEAMSCGKPVVGSNIPGINDIIINMKSGLLVPPKDPKAIAKAILMLLNNEELRFNLGINARNSIVNRHRWSLISAKVESAYMEAIKK